MNRRRLLAVLASSVSAGCLGGSAPITDSGEATTDSGEPTTDSGEPTPNDCIATTVYSLKSGRLEIETWADTDLPVTTTLVDGCTDETVLDRTRTLAVGDSIDLDLHFERGRPYDFTLTIDGTVQFQKRILDYEGYQLAIKSRNEVEITEYIVA